MNRREARIRAHEFAYIALQEWLDLDWGDHLEHGDDASKIEEEMQELVQRHYERAFPERKKR